MSPSLVLANDGMLDFVDSARTAFIVEVVAGQLRARERIIVGYTGSSDCRCHVTLLQGPIRIIAR